jgi:hypothetical protein
MKTLMGVTLFGLALLLMSCSTNPPAIPPPSTAHAKLAPRQSEAPTGFDNKSNAVVDDQTHGLDQANFEQFEAISDGLGPLFNAAASAIRVRLPAAPVRSQSFVSDTRGRAAISRIRRFLSTTVPSSSRDARW